MKSLQKTFYAWTIEEDIIEALADCNTSFTNPRQAFRDATEFCKQWYPRDERPNIKVWKVVLNAEEVEWKIKETMDEKSNLHMDK